MKMLLTVGLLITGLFGSASAAQLSQSQGGHIAQVVGRILEQVHFKQQPLNDEISRQLFDNYFEALDNNRMIFLKSDRQAFQDRYLDRLDDYTLEGSAKPAFEIYERFLERLKERDELVHTLLEREFDFTEEESYFASREEAEWPKDANEAAELWRKRIKYELLQGRLAEEDPQETRDRIAKRYDRLYRTMSDFTPEDILQTYLTALAHAYDPHTDYMSPPEAENFDITNIKLSLTGIGARLMMDDGYTKIVELIPGGPAEMSNELKPNDRIVAVAQGDEEPVDTVEMRLSKVVQLIRGERGTEVRLTVIPAGSPDGSERHVVSLIRDEIQLKEQYAKAKIIDHPAGDGETVRIGVITLPQFYDGSADDVSRLLGRLKEENIRGLLLDLRRNGGGILNEAIDMAGLFIQEGPIVQVKNHRQQVMVMGDDDPELVYDGPMLVLAGHLSASASEIVAAALQDYDRAIIVGDESTHGKGTVQSLVSLNNFLNQDYVAEPGKLKLTVSKFYRIAGGTTQKQGVTPDIILPSVFSHMEIGEATLENSLPADSIEPLDYEELGKVDPYLQKLEQRSRKRVEQSADFAYVKEDIQHLQERQAEKRVSLNESERLAEKEARKKRLEKREEERAQRADSKAKVYELTVDMVKNQKALHQVADANTEAEGDSESDADGDDEEDSASETSASTIEMDPTMDAQFQESLNILHDYVGLLRDNDQEPKLKSISSK